MKIVDLHTHVLPGVDDGAQTMAQSLEMLRNACASDVVALVATPHCCFPGVFENRWDEAFSRKMEALQEAARSLPIEIYSGMEVRVNESLFSLLEANQVRTINGSRYLLTEFSWRDTVDFMGSSLRRLLKLGYVPLIAHPERYFAVTQNPECMREFVEMGCHLQLTADSILGKFGRDAAVAADILLRWDLTACVASDAHGVWERTNFLTEAYEYLALYGSAAYAKTLMLENPLRILENEPI